MSDLEASSNHVPRIHVDPATLESREHGAYAIVLKSPEGYAVKAFKAGKDREHTRQVFEAEVEAYMIASRTPVLAAMTPTFHGVCVGPHRARQGRIDVECVPELAYCISWVDGIFVKYQLCEEIASQFREAGIRHLSDVSAVVTPGARPRAIIDFATREVEQWF